MTTSGVFILIVLAESLFLVVQDLNLALVYPMGRWSVKLWSFSLIVSSSLYCKRHWRSQEWILFQQKPWLITRGLLDLVLFS